jgi:hypothetical protein
MTRGLIVAVLAVAASTAAATQRQPQPVPPSPASSPSPSPSPSPSARPSARPSASPSPSPTASSATPDIELTADVRWRELRFESVGTPSVEFSGNPSNETVWEAERQNLPKPVQPGVTYTNGGVRLVISTRFQELAQALDGAPSPAPAASPSPSDRPAASPSPSPSPSPR